MSAVRIAELRSQRATLVLDEGSFSASAAWWRAEAADAPSTVAAAYARQSASRLELRAHAVRDHIAEIDRQIDELQGVFRSPYRAPISLSSEQCEAVDDMAFGKVSA